ncbi:hypothetical protein ESCO_005334 [Escovopsis weberi]|uniref:Peptidase A1 domain-containing protein n=1 Tax=Escovopsis weberi TaxID=150374 RepID=A0A0N0RTM8_ESCWE|nr:hypothetical protein ESCO_005334 [Escovopsis weberi]
MAKLHRRREHAWRLALLLVASSLSLALADTCVPPPVSFPIVNVTLPDGNIRRGASVKVGQPPKEYSFLPNWGVNNTYLFGPDCPSEDFIHSAAACDTFRGGLYKPDASSTDAHPNASYVPAPDRFPAATYSLFTEKLTFDRFSLADVVLGRPLNVSKWDLQAYNPQHMLGLARGSTILGALSAAGRVLSSSYGFFWGLDGLGDRDQFPGSLILGGYDRAKTIGNGYTQALTPRADCPTGLMVLISDMVLNFRTGKDVSIFPGGNGGTALQACLVPELPVLIELPLDPYFSNMEKAIENEEVARSVGVDWWNVILNGSLPLYGGDLTFKLDSGLQLTIPNRQLIVPDRSINDDGAVTVNASRPVIRIDSLQSTTALSLPRIGRYFFTAAYLMSNPDAGKFTLWQANPVNDVDLVAVDASNAIVPTNSSCTPAASSGSGSGSGSGAAVTPTQDPQPAPASGLSPGAIAGIAVGAAVVLGALGLLAWWLIRRRRNNERGPEDAASAAPMASWTQGAQELGSPEQTKQGGSYAYYGHQEHPAPPPSEMPVPREHTISPGSVELEA